MKSSLLLFSAVILPFSSSAFLRNSSSGRRSEPDSPPTAPPPPTSAPEPDTWYDVEVYTTDACMGGTVEVIVNGSDGLPVEGVSLGFLLVGNTSQGYAGSGVTDENGHAAFDFTADDADLGETLWCSIAIDNPKTPYGNQQVPCSVTVCTEK